MPRPLPRRALSLGATVLVAAFSLAACTVSSGLGPSSSSSSPSRPTGSTGGTSGGQSDQACPTGYESTPPLAADVTFKTFRSRSGSLTPISLDVYAPPGSDPAPAVVLVHGGGWAKGCKTLLSGPAAELASAGFIVLAIDYRLSCTKADQPATEEAPLCGWTAAETDPTTGTRGAAVHDVEDAVAWARDHAGDYHPFNGKVGVAGGSAGGTLVYMAGAGAADGDPERPDAVAGWSGLTEFGKASDGTYSCDGAAGGKGAPYSCWKAVVQYIGCDIRKGGSGCAADYAAASPVHAYTSAGPPAFIANSDGELVYVKDARDLDSALRGFGIPEQLCIVPDSNLHARGYLDIKACGVSGPKPAGDPSVLDSTAAFLHQHLG